MTYAITPTEFARDTAQPIGGSPPDLAWVKVSDLVVEGYQRLTTEKAGQALIASIAAAWSWDRCGAIIVRPCRVDGAARLAVVDGQHRAIAALSRGDIDALPAAIIGVETAQGAARTFIGLNLDRRNLSAQAVFWAEVEAGHAAATEIKAAADAAHVTVLRAIKPADSCTIGETSSVGSLRNVHRVNGSAVLTRALKIAVVARVAPIKGWHIEASALAITAPELKGRASDSALAAVLLADEDGIEDAADLAAADTGQAKKRCAAIEMVNRAGAGR